MPRARPNHPVPPPVLADAPEAAMPAAPVTDESFEESAADRVAVLIRSAIGDGDPRADVRVYKVRDGNELSWCENYKPEVFEDGSLELIRKKWGPGRYHIKLYGTLPGTKRFVIRAAETVNIEAPMTAADGAGGVEISTPLLALLSKIDQRLATIEVKPADPQASIVQTLGLMKAMREAMNGTAVAVPPPQSPVSAIKEIMTMLEAVKVIRENIEPTQAPDDPLMAMLPKVIDMINLATQRQGQGGELPQLAPPASLAAAPVEDDAMLQMNAAVALLNSRASRNADVNESADMVYENAPDELLEMLAAPTWFEALGELAPAIKPWRPWYERLRARVLDIQREEAAAAELPPPVARLG